VSVSLGTFFFVSSFDYDSRGMKGRGRKGMMGSKRGPGFFDWMN
jgi:hypothetical protein